MPSAESSRAGFMKAFYAKTGNHKLRFKPAYNPYTEPSMEVFSWHEGLQKWIEIANVGSRCPSCAYR